jgi:hypothetical protein
VWIYWTATIETRLDLYPLTDCLRNRRRDNCLLDKTTGGQRAACYSCLNALYIIQADDQRISWVMFSNCIHQYSNILYKEVHINWQLKAEVGTPVQISIPRFQFQGSNPVAKFIVSDWGDKVNSGIGLSYRPARLYIGWRTVQQTYAGVNYILQSGTMNLATGATSTGNKLAHAWFCLIIIAKKRTVYNCYYFGSTIELTSVYTFLK